MFKNVHWINDNISLEEQIVKKGFINYVLNKINGVEENIHIDDSDNDMDDEKEIETYIPASFSDYCPFMQIQDSTFFCIMYVF